MRRFDHHRLAVIGGDGIGQELMPEGIRVLEAAGRRFGLCFEWDQLPWSSAFWPETGHMMPGVAWTASAAIARALAEG